MRLLRDKFMILADPNLKAYLPILGLNGTPLRLSRQFDPYRHSTQIGVIHEVPMEFSEESIDSHLLKKGDTVWFHHFVCQPKNRWMIDGVEMFQASWGQIFAKIEEDGTLVPMNEYVFVEPIIEGDGDLWAAGLKLRDTAQAVQMVGTAFAVSAKASSLGINRGDKIHYMKGADYEMNIEGKKLWLMKIQHITAIERDPGYINTHPPGLHGNLVPLANRVIVREDERPEYVERFGMKLPNTERPKQHYGVVTGVGSEITEIGTLDQVCFLHGTSAVIYKDGAEFAVLKKENIISIESKATVYEPFNKSSTQTKT